MWWGAARRELASVPATIERMLTFLPVGGTPDHAQMRSLQDRTGENEIAFRQHMLDLKLKIWDCSEPSSHMLPHVFWRSWSGCFRLPDRS
jgi:hypothetical protein